MGTRPWQGCSTRVGTSGGGSPGEEAAKARDAYLNQRGGVGVGEKHPGFSPPPALGLSPVSSVGPNSFLGRHVTLAESNS